MLQLLFILFIAVPILEIYLLIQVGSHFGAGTTVLLVVVTAVVGAYLVRQQGFATLQRVQRSLHEGKMPAMEMLEAVVLLVAGALLMTPGFCTDALGFSCLVPRLRRHWVSRLLQRLVVNTVSSQTRQASRNPGQPKVIEGEYRREDD